MNKIFKTGIVVAALVTCVSMASAQAGTGQRGGGFGQRGGGFGQRRQGGGGELFLAMRKDVQADLAVTDDQKKKLDELRAKQRESMRGQGGNRRRGGGGGGAAGSVGGAGTTGGTGTGGATGTGAATGSGTGARRGQDADAAKKQREEAHKNLAEILNETQMKRLAEISLQLQGNRALNSPDIQKQLGLSTDQISKIKDLQTKMREANQSLGQKVGDKTMTREDANKAREANTKAFDEEVAKILTAEQNDKFKAMQGKPFKADANETGRRGGGG